MFEWPRSSTIQFVDNELMRCWYIRLKTSPLADTIFDVVVAADLRYTCAIRASQYGAEGRADRCEFDRLGGTCLLLGCIPTKAILFNAEVYDHLKHADGTASRASAR